MQRGLVLKWKWLSTQIFFSIIITPIVFGNVALAQIDSPDCKEECLEIRDKNIEAYRKCVESGDKTQDRISLSRHRSYCRKRHELPACDHLPPCEKKAEEVKPDASGQLVIKDAFKIEQVRLQVLQPKSDQKVNEFNLGQTVWVRYLVKVDKATGSRVNFEQKMIITDSKGQEIFSDRKNLKREGGLLNEYSMKTSFSIPEKNFEVGTYNLQLDVRERYSGWQTKEDTQFTVKK